MRLNPHKDPDRQDPDLTITLRECLLHAVLVRVKTDPLSLPRGIRSPAAAVVEADEEEE